MSTEKGPLMTRLSRRLEKHGLGFGDALNIALFLLTLASLYLAYQGVRLARITLADARVQAAKASQDQDAQFQEQMKQLKASSDALRTTSTLLSTQSDILRDLQGTSRQQLKDLNAAEIRVQRQERARPELYIASDCNGITLLPAQKTETNYIEPVILYVPTSDVLRCWIAVKNYGDAELRNATLTMAILGCSKSTLYFASANAVQGTETILQLISHQNLPPNSKSGRTFNSEFSIFAGPKCSGFFIQVKLEADNLKTTDILTDVKLQHTSVESPD